MAHFISNHIILTGNQYDSIVEKALKIKQADKLNPIIHNHREIMYYPKAELLTEIAKQIIELDNNEALVKFTNAIFRRQ